jgi:UDP-N-acetylglucosamine 2-epimerase (non-hydrolysing)
MEEVLEYYDKKINSSKICSELGLSSRNYFVISAHREENVDTPERLSELVNSLNALVEKYDIPAIFSVHPRTKARLDELPESKLDKKVKLMKAMGFMDYIQLQKNAKCVISDSGTIAEESSLLKFPAVTLRQAHERPEGMDEGILIMSDIKPEQVLQSVETILYQHDNFAMKSVKDYCGGKVSVKVSRIIHSYTDYINRTVWRDYK